MMRGGSSLRQRFGGLNLTFEVSLKRDCEARHQQERADQQRKNHDENDRPARAAFALGLRVELCVPFVIRRRP